MQQLQIHVLNHRLGSTEFRVRTEGFHDYKLRMNLSERFYIFLDYEYYTTVIINILYNIQNKASVWISLTYK